MPLYQYQRDDNGEMITRLFLRAGSQPRTLTYRNDPDHALPKGVRATFAPFAPQAPRRARERRFPFASTSLAVDNTRLHEARATLGCNFTPSGRAIFESPSHQDHVLKRAGYVNISDSRD